MFTYGYIKNAILAKMNLSEQEALEQNILDGIPYYLNECLTQITSTIKPKYSWVMVTVYCDTIPIPKELQKPDKQESLEEMERREKALEEYLKDKTFINTPYKMPDDFIAFSGKSMVSLEIKNPFVRYVYDKPQEVHEHVAYISNNSLIFKHPGKYIITYDAQWEFFKDTTLDEKEIDIPADIVQCLPAYVASQLWKIDDERKAAIYRNEFEMAFARINNADPRGNLTFVSEGGW